MPESPRPVSGKGDRQFNHQSTTFADLQIDFDRTTLTNGFNHLNIDLPLSSEVISTRNISKTQ